VFRWQRERAREDGLSKIRYGALVMQHRFGSSLNLNTHLHAVFPDGVFSRSPSGEVEFNELRQPAPDDLEDIAFNVHQRFPRWLRRHSLLKNEAERVFSNESPELSALEVCAQGSLGLGNLVKTRGKSRMRRQNSDDDGLEQSNVSGRVGASHGYSLYASNAITAGDKDARECLLRYFLRAPLSLEHLSIGPDGNVIYQVKATRHGNETQRIMSPMQFMARLVALIPPPYHPCDISVYLGLIHLAENRLCLVWTSQNQTGALAISDHVSGISLNSEILIAPNKPLRKLPIFMRWL
jgi:hypothetical protein